MILIVLVDLVLLLLLLSIELLSFTALHDYAYVLLIEFVNCATQTDTEN